MSDYDLHELEEQLDAVDAGDDSIADIAVVAVRVLLHIATDVHWMRTKMQWPLTTAPVEQMPALPATPDETEDVPRSDALFSMSYHHCLACDGNHANLPVYAIGDGTRWERFQCPTTGHWLVFDSWEDEISLEDDGE